jgi:hypothetical protein
MMTADNVKFMHRMMMEIARTPIPLSRHPRRLKLFVSFLKSSS